MNKDPVGKGIALKCKHNIKQGLQIPGNQISSKCGQKTL